MTTLQLDVTSDESIAAAVKAVEELTQGKLDVLVNNAYIYLSASLRRVIVT
jgi:NAD(P)-dependent dehydrogenase (short-subunit alcohol dehydrogenase family)